MNLLRFALLPVLSLAFASGVRAQETWVGASDITFKGYSFLHDFTGTVKSVPLKVIVSQKEGGRILNATSVVEVKQMNTRNEERDRNMMLMFNEARHPLIRIEVVNAEERSLKPQGATPGTMPVMLTIAGRRGTVSGNVTNVVESREAVSFDLAFPVSLSAFSLDPPKALAGLMKVKDRVDVTAHVELKRSER